MSSINVLDSHVNKVLTNLPKLIGGSYGTFWHFKGRYRVVKGGRASKKSVTNSFWFPLNMMYYYHMHGAKPNTLVIRQYYNTHKDSTYAQLKWAINQAGVAHLWRFKLSPLELTYLPSGQKIMFRGMDDPDSVTSITVDDGDLCWTWWEEAYQVQNEEAFNKVDLSIRGQMHPALFKQHTLSMNPWSEKIWIKPRFFDVVNKETGISEDGNILAITRNYDCNEFLSLDDIELFEHMKKNNPRRYWVEGLGNWGIIEGVVYTNWRMGEFDFNKLYAQRDGKGQRKHKLMLGLDFGYSVDPAAFVALLVNERAKKIYVFNEMYETKYSNQQIYDHIKGMGFQHDRIWADSADPRTISELKMKGLSKIKGVKKGGKNYKEAAALVLQDYEIIVHPRCGNFEIEISNYSYSKDKKTGEILTKLADEFDHLMDAMIYATCKIDRSTFAFAKDFHKD